MSPMRARKDLGQYGICNHQHEADEKLGFDVCYMEDEDEESDDGKECEDDSDNTQEDGDNKVADMLQNQHQYIQMCSSSAQLLQLLSRLVPGAAISGQMMTLESITDDSGDSTPGSATASLSHSPATSDDNSGCVIWAKPIMTCELGPSWKPYCNDVRRLPRGVRPEDIKNKRHPESEGLSEKGHGSCTAGNRLKYLGNKKDAVLHPSNGPTVPAQDDTRARTEDSKQPSIESQRLEDGGSNIRATHSVFNEAMSTISVAADTIKKARNILATVGTGRQANNNNNPEVSGDNASLNSGTEKSGKSNSEKSANNDRHGETTTEMNTAVEGTSGGSAQGRQRNHFLRLLTGGSPITSFPPPILVKSAGAQGNVSHYQPETIQLVDSTEKTISMPSVDVPENNQSSGQDVPGLLDQNSYSAEHPSYSTKNLNSGQSKVPTESRASRCVRPSRVTGQLYRNPYISTPHSSNRTQQSVSLGATETENPVLPPPVNLPIKQQSTKQSIYEKLLLDFNILGINSNVGAKIQRHKITPANLKNALEMVLRDLKKQNVWEISENSANTGQSLDTISTMNVFTINEVNNLNGAVNHIERDTQSSGTTQAICNDLVCEATNAAECNAGGDSTLSNADLSTEVENIFYFEHQSSKRSSMEAEGTGSQDELSSNECDEEKSETFRLDSPSSTQALDLSRDVSPVGKNESSHISQIKNSSHSRRDNSHSSCRKECTGRPGSCRESTNKAMTNYHVHNSPKTEVDVCSDKGKETKRDDYANKAARRDHQHTNTKIKDDIDESDRHRVSQIFEKQSTEEGDTNNITEISANNIPQTLNCRILKVNSIEDRDSVHAVNNSCKPQDASMHVERKDQMDNKCSHELIVTNRDNFPPTFTEAGDIVGSLTKSSDVKKNSFNSNRQDVVRREVHFKARTVSDDSNSRHNKSKTVNLRTVVSRRQSDESNEKIAWRSGKRQSHFEIGESKNASLNKERNRNVQSSDYDKVLDFRSKQPDIDEELDANTEEAICTHDEVIEIRINQGKGIPVIVLEGENDDTIQQNVFISQSSLPDYQNSVVLRGKNFKDQTLDFLNSEAPLRRAKEDMQIDSIEKSGSNRSVPVDSSLITTFGNLSSISLGKRFRHRSKCRSNADILKNNRSKETSKSEYKEIVASSNALLSSNSHLECQNMIPITQLEEQNTHLRTKMHAPCTKPVLIYNNHEESQSTASDCSHHPIFQDVLSNELIDRYVKVQASSVENLNASFHSFRSSSLDSVSLTTADDLAPSLVSPTAGTASSDAFLGSDDKQGQQGGLKMRFRRLFEQCLHPFGNKK